MKKLILLKITSLLLIFNTSLFAQDFKFGLVGGLDVANSHLTNKSEVNSDSRVYYPMISFNANGYIGYRSTGLWGISLEPGYIKKGGVQQYDEDNDVKCQISYLQLPVLADFYLSEKIFISVGPEFAYQINAKANAKDYSLDISDLYDNDFELSGIIGINYNIQKHFDVGVKYSHGLTYVSKNSLVDEAGESSEDSKEYNQYFQLFVRFKI